MFNILKNLIPREEKFHDLFDEATAILSRASGKFLDLVIRLDRLESRCNDLKAEEHAGDEIVERIIKALDRSFVTPFDREDIHNLATRIDDVLDHMEEAAHRFMIFRVDHATPQAVELAEILQKSCLEIEHAVRECRHMKHPKVIQDHIKNIIRLENRGDQLYREAARDLYTDPKDLLLLSKWRELYDRLEKSIDSCKEVGHIVSEIVIKGS